MLTTTASDGIQLLYRNARQMKKIVEAKYASLSFPEKPLNDRETESACGSTNVSNDEAWSVDVADSR